MVTDILEEDIHSGDDTMGSSKMVDGAGHSSEGVQVQDDN